MAALPLPWRTGPAVVGPDTAAPVVLGSRLELARWRDVPGFVLAALRLRGAAAGAPGGLGLALLAEPAQRRFWTVSAWEDQGALDGFTADPAHRAVMRRYRGRLRASQFETWTADAGALPPGWDEVRARLAGAVAATPPS